MVAKQGAELAVIDPGQYAILAADPREVADVLREALGGSQIGPRDFQTFKVPSQGMTVWSYVDALTGEVVTTPEIQGVIVHNKLVRAFWEEKYSGGGVPPDCASDDGLLGHGLYGAGSDRNPSGACRSCPMAEFGSAAALWPGDGQTQAQACKANRLLFVLTADGFLPAVIKVPPASLKEIKQFILALASKGIAPTSAVVRFGLAAEKSATGLRYSKIVPRFGARLSRDQAAQVQGIAAQLRVALDGAVSPAGWTFLKDDGDEDGE